jgi:redox-sensing transcriptional repressor
MASIRTIGRLSLYRRTLLRVRAEGRSYLYSHQLAAESGVTAAQVRRDLMAIGYQGSPNRGYDVAALLASIAEFMDAPGGQGVALVGLGNLGRAILGHVQKNRPSLQVRAAFDLDPEKVGRVVHGCRCHALSDLPAIARELNLSVAILTVPPAAAQAAVDQLVGAGIHGILNLAPVTLRVPGHVYVEDLDLTMSLEKVAYLGRRHGSA